MYETHPAQRERRKKYEKQTRQRDLRRTDKGRKIINKNLKPLRNGSAQNQMTKPTID